MRKNETGLNVQGGCLAGVDAGESAMRELMSVVESHPEISNFHISDTVSGCVFVVTRRESSPDEGGDTTLRMSRPLNWPSFFGFQACRQKLWDMYVYGRSVSSLGSGEAVVRIDPLDVAIPSEADTASGEIQWEPIQQTLESEGAFGEYKEYCDRLWANLVGNLNRPQREYLDWVTRQSSVAETAQSRFNEATTRTANRVTRKHHKSVRSGSKKERRKQQRIERFVGNVIMEDISMMSGHSLASVDAGEALHVSEGGRK